MGLLDTVFGGGTGVAVALDANEFIDGGTLSGVATVQGGKKSLRLACLTIRLLYRNAEGDHKTPIADVEPQVLAEVIVARNQDLPEAQQRRYPFVFTLACGLPPTGNTVQYQLVADADIPDVRDPSVAVEVRIVEAPAPAAATPG